MLPMPFMMFMLLLLLLFLNIPVYISLFLVSILFGFILWGEQSLHIVFNAIWSTMNNWGLVSLPLFVLMSALMEECKLADEMFRAFNNWIGGIRGALLIVATLLGFTIGAMSGVVAAGVVTLAFLVYPQMMKYNYPKKLSIGALIAAGSLPQLVPPSLNMIVYGILTGVSIGKLFAGGLGMSIVMTALFIIYILIWCQLNKDKVPITKERVSLKEKFLSLKGLIGPLAIIFGTLGTIFTGIATPTEAAGVGAFLTLIYAAIRRRLTKDALMKSLLTTLKVTSMACWIVAGAVAFGSIFSGVGGRRAIIELLLSLPQARITAVIAALALIFFLGMFIETVSIASIIGPILAPVMEALGYDPVWWGTIFCTILMTAFLTPPVGMSMYYFKASRPEVTMEEIYKAVWPFVGLQVLTTALGIIFPEIPLFFVRLFFRG